MLQLVVRPVLVEVYHLLVGVRVGIGRVLRPAGLAVRRRLPPLRARSARPAPRQVLRAEGLDARRARRAGQHVHAPRGRAARRPGRLLGQALG